MTGTGTQNDPFIISDWTDFITAVGTSGAYVEFPKNLVRTADADVDSNKLYTDVDGIVQTNVQPSDLAGLYENTFLLDANDYAPAGVTSTITINCTSLNGNGGYIKNLASNSADIFTTAATPEFSQLAILNINVEDTAFITGSSGVHYDKCIFSGRAKGSSGTHRVFGGNTNSHSSIYYSCAFTFDLIGSYDLFNYLDWYGFAYAGPLYDCRLSITHIDRGGITAGGTLWVRLENSYLTGVIAGTVSITITAQSHYSVVEVENSGSISVNDAQGGTVQLILINDELYTGTIPTGCRGVTTAQLKDASYLSSIGFPVQT